MNVYIEGKLEHVGFLNLIDSYNYYNLTGASVITIIHDVLSSMIQDREINLTYKEFIHRYHVTHDLFEYRVVSEKEMAIFFCELSSIYETNHMKTVQRLLDVDNKEGHVINILCEEYDLNDILSCVFSEAVYGLLCQLINLCKKSNLFDFKETWSNCEIYDLQVEEDSITPSISFICHID